MSQLLKLQTRLMARGIAGALAATIPSELLAKATIRYCQATEIFIKEIDEYRGKLDAVEIRKAVNDAMDVALTADLLMAACVAQREKEEKMANDATEMAKIIEFPFAQKSPPKPSAS